MNGIHGPTWVVIAYVAGLGLLWGYAASVWVAGRRLGGDKRCDVSGKE